MGLFGEEDALPLPLLILEHQGAERTVRPPLDLLHPAVEPVKGLGTAAGAQGKQKERGQQKAPFLHVVHSPIRG